MAIGHNSMILCIMYYPPRLKKNLLSEIWRKQNENMDPSCLVTNVQAGGGGVMVDVFLTHFRPLSAKKTSPRWSATLSVFKTSDGLAYT